jgi:hypothetical protein
LRAFVRESVAGDGREDWLVAGWPGLLLSVTTGFAGIPERRVILLEGLRRRGPVVEVAAEPGEGGFDEGSVASAGLLASRGG